CGGEAGPSDAERLLCPLRAGQPGRRPFLLALRRAADAGRGRAARREHLDDLAGRHRSGRWRLRGAAARVGHDRGPAGRHRPAPGQARAERRQPVPAGQRADHGRPPPGQRHFPRRCDGVPAPRRVLPARIRVRRARRGQPERHLREPGADRGDQPERRGRGPGGQVPADLPRGQAIAGRPWRGRTGRGMSAEPARAYFGIGEVIAQLRAEFPDVSVSKIRFLEAEGLIQPARSPSGYRKFAPADVDRLRYILTAQRDQYLPLRVIKDQLESDQPAAGPMSRRELLEANGIAAQELAALGEFGMVRRSGRQYPPEAVEAVQAIAALGQYGVQPRHLRVLRASVERETALIEQVVAPVLRQRSPGARERAATSAREIASLVLAVHAALIEMTLTDAGFAGPEGGGTGRSAQGAGVPAALAGVL